MNHRHRLLFWVIALVVGWGVVPVAAQTGGNTGTDGGSSAVNNLFGGGNGGGGDAFDGLSLGDNLFQLQNDIEVATSERFQNGFIGTTASDVDSNGVDNRSLGFIGQRNEGELGGGVNDSLTLGSNSSTARGGQTGGFVGGGTSLYFEVQRRGVRARLRPSFSIRSTVDNELRVGHFVNRLDRMPATRELAKSYQIRIENRTATISGTVRTEQEKRQIERQLRLEPGVYRINNQLRVQE